MLEDEGTLPSPRLIGAECYREIDDYLVRAGEHQTSPSENVWILCIAGAATGYIIGSVPTEEVLPFQGAFVLDWGQSAEVEFPWVQSFRLERGAKSSVKNLKLLFTEISNLVGREEFPQLDRIVQLAHPSRYNLDFCLGVLRATFLVKDRLPSWRRCLDHTRDALLASGEDVKAELAGLE